MTHFMTHFKIALTTAASAEEAARLARHLVEGKLAACVNIIGGVNSVYRWKEQVEESAEVLLVIKTSADRLAAVEEALRSLSSYELPEFLVLGIEGGSRAYMGWLAAGLGQ